MQHNKLKKYSLISLNTVTSWLIATLILAHTASAEESPKASSNTPPKAHQNYRKVHSEYNDALRTMWTTVYPGSAKTLYCDFAFSTKKRRQRRKTVNAEHVFPMSWVTKDLKCGTRKQCRQASAAFRQIEADLHNIYPAKINVNKARSNFRFGHVPGEQRNFGRCDFEVNRRARVAEPTPKKRGEIARAMLYMRYQYDLTLHKKTAALMYKWHRQDPPTQEETRRAKQIQKAQGRENPFITRYPFQQPGG